MASVIPYCIVFYLDLQLSVGGFVNPLIDALVMNGRLRYLVLSEKEITMQAVLALRSVIKVTFARMCVYLFAFEL